jgi:hypothetical protein
MYKAGAPEEELQKQRDVIAGIRDDLGTLEQTKQDFVQNEANKQVRDFRNLKDTLAEYDKMYREAMTDEERENIRKQAEEEVEPYGYGLGESGIHLDYESRQDYNARIAAAERDFSQLEQNETTSAVEEYYNNNKEAAEDYLSVLRGASKEDLEGIQLSNGKYDVEGSEKYEDALQGLADAAGISADNIDELIAAIIKLNETEPEVEVPEALKEGRAQVEEFMGSHVDHRGAPFSLDLDANLASMTKSDLESRLS